MKYFKSILKNFKNKTTNIISTQMITFTNLPTLLHKVKGTIFNSCIFLKQSHTAFYLAYFKK